MDPKKALNLAAGLCSKKEHCCREIREKLGKWEIPENEINRILDFLTQNKFIDESRFAIAYARDKFRFNKWGKQKITQMLRQKGIQEDIILQALDGLGKNEYEEACLKLLLQKKKNAKDTDHPLKDKNRLIRFALSRGFDYDTVRRCIERPEFNRTNEADLRTDGRWDE